MSLQRMWGLAAFVVVSVTSTEAAHAADPADGKTRARRAATEATGETKPGDGRKRGSAARTAFQTRDRNGDGALSEEEFLQGHGEADRPLVKRDFHMLDFNRNGLLSLDEFRNVPYLVPREERGELPDPLARLVNEHFDASLEKWNEFDTNGDGSLDQQEVRAAGLIGVNIENADGNVQTWFSLDRDRDGKVSREEWLWQLEVWYGIRRPQGELLRSPSGILIIWMYYKHCDRNNDDRIDHDEFLKHGYDGADAEKRFAELDQNADRVITFDEWPTHDSRIIDLFWLMRHFDSSLDGKLDADELLKNCGEWQRPIARHMFPGFDTNGDGFLSISEFAFTPLFLQLAQWQNVRTDQDGDRRLSLNEFQFESGPSLKGLTAEYFRRLDTNADGFLDEQEWEFHIPKAPEIRLFSMSVDGTDVELLADTGLFGTTALGSPDWSPDGASLVFDATPARGVHSDFSQTVLVRVEMSGPDKGKFQKLGFGNCPDWSPDGKQITFFVNGGNPANDPHGVWISNADGSGRKLLFQGHWSPRWTRDGKHIICSNSFRAPKRYVQVDVATGESHVILGECQAIGVPDREPAGERLCVMRRVGNERRLSLCNAAGEEGSMVDLWKSPIDVPEGATYHDTSLPCWSQDGLEILFTDNSKGRATTRRVAAKGGSDSIEVPSPFKYDCVGAIWSPDRRRVVFASAQPLKEIPGLKLKEIKGETQRGN